MWDQDGVRGLVLIAFLILASCFTKWYDRTNKKDQVAPSIEDTALRAYVYSLVEFKRKTIVALACLSLFIMLTKFQGRAYSIKEESKQVFLVEWQWWGLLEKNHKIRWGKNADEKIWNLEGTGWFIDDPKSGLRPVFLEPSQRDEHD